jgi:hypothetical protein
MDVATSTGRDDEHQQQQYALPPPALSAPMAPMVMTVLMRGMGWVAPTSHALAVPAVDARD